MLILILENPTAVQATLDQSGDVAIVTWKMRNEENANGCFVEFCDIDDEKWNCANSKGLEQCNAYPVTDLQRGKYYRYD